ncbi:response regulator [Paenibacillus sp. 1011MAR3C5]|uniref:response regulator n=1 Tax=Paenibacillus sp. 1011MAR3C5 TaxID=1675787 RepID=UPI000E6D49A6|nr:response regulator [Paenibacillus sp. 1011MAR3C5]RJE83966.1 response regulator [Paenibacillus sp. 1011MAR3C5]
MLTAILVDDEPMTRKGLLRFVDWQRLGIQIGGEAEDGLEAYELYVELRPELVLCDVRMPRMDGIELAHRIRQIDPDCKIIFLSGYNDVEYLKSAIQLQAVDYMLKPIQMEELTALIEKTAASISHARSKQQEVDEMREQLDRSKPELAERLFKMLLKTGPEFESEYITVEKAIARLSPELLTKGWYQIAVFRFQTEDALQHWREEAEAAAAEAGLNVMTADMNGVCVALLALSSQRQDDLPALWLNRLTRRRGNEERGVVAGVGEPFQHLKGCATSYEQAAKALSHSFYRGWNTVIWYSNLAPQQNTASLFSQQAFITFEELLRGKELRAASEWLDQTINELLLKPPLDVESVRKKLFRWYVAMTRIYSETMWEFENDYLWATTFMSGELYMIRKFMLQRLDILQEALDQTLASDKSVIRDMIRFIQQNYNQDVSINTVAAHVHLAPTYMCILFKKEKGVSINDYITQYRIEQAKRLLRDRKLKLYEVSHMVGYQDPNYFSKVFRKLAGVIPSQYRESQREEG